MTIWSSEIKELETLYASVKGKFPEMEKELGHLIKTDDENVALLYSRRCLEVIITDLCKSELKRPRKTEPLKGIIDKLSHEEKVPSHIVASMQNLNTLSTFGAHPKEFDPEQVRPVLINLITIIKWYLNYKAKQATIKPEEKVVKDEIKVSEVSSEHIKIPKKRFILLLSGLALIVIIIVAVLFVFNLIGGGKRIDGLEKSIAVLPFVNDSKDEENTYFINGIMDEVLINLQTIKDLRVISRNSVEQYRGPDEPATPEIAKRLDVNYIVEGSGQKFGNTFVLRVQLLDGPKDRHLWGESYEQKIESIEDIIRIQSQIAEAIANELNVIITTEEKQIIEKIPTTSLTAYDFCQRGQAEYEKFLVNYKDTAAFRRAEVFYFKALEYDSTFAEIYVGLAGIHISKSGWHIWEDSCFHLVDLALSYNDHCSPAYLHRGIFYMRTGKPELAIHDFNKALKYNPNYYDAYIQLGTWNLNISCDLVEAVDNFYRASKLHRGLRLTDILRNIAIPLAWSGFPEQARLFRGEALELDGDSVAYFSGLALDAHFNQRFQEANEYWRKAYALDTNNIDIMCRLGENYLFLDKYHESLEFFKKSLDATNYKWQEQPIYQLHHMAFAFWQNGYQEEAEKMFKEEIDQCNYYNEIKNLWATINATYFYLAAVYAFMGEKEKVIDNLRIYSTDKISITANIINDLRNDPIFDKIRNETEFQHFLSEAEAKYQAEHERVKKWLEEQGML